MKNLTPESCLEILKKYNTKPNLIKHALAVAGAMKHFASLLGKDENFWQCVGILHDIDYEMYPDQHCKKAVELLQNDNFDDVFIHAVQSHGWELCTDVKPSNIMELIQCIVDQLTGFIIACALIRPEKKLELVDLKSVHKRWVIPSFAAGTNRERIMRYCELLAQEYPDKIPAEAHANPFDWVAVETLKAMQSIASDLGL